MRAEKAKIKVKEGELQLRKKKQKNPEISTGSNFITHTFVFTITKVLEIERSTLTAMLWLRTVARDYKSEDKLQKTLNTIVHTIC